MYNELHEECGVFGVYSRDGLDVASLCYYGLYALQHRGQAVSYTHLGGVFRLRGLLRRRGELFRDRVWRRDHRLFRL